MFFERLLLPVLCLAFEVVGVSLAEEVEIRDVAADKGTNVSIPCGGLPPALTVQWVHRGSRTHHEVLSDGSLLLKHIGVEDAGLYECGVENETAFVDRVNLTVRTEPPALVNVTVHASTILALVLWNVAGDGGHPIIDFTAQYRSAAPVNSSLEPWRPISPNHISPNSRQIDVYHLDTNASYWFRVWATNVLGPGPPVEVLATTLYTDQDAELYKHFLEGAESFDTRTWVAAVSVVMGTLLVLAAGTCAVLCREWRRPEITTWFEMWKYPLPAANDISEVDRYEKHLIDYIDEAKDFFPSVAEAIKIGLSLPVTTCTIERSFSTLRRVKTWNRSTTGDERLSGLCLLSVHRGKITKDNKDNFIENVINKFGQKPRRLQLLFK